MDGVNPGAVWPVGHRPDPRAWTSWEYAGDNARFHGRWDDPAGRFRTVYAGADLLGCLLEVLARFHPDPLLTEELAAKTRTLTTSFVTQSGAEGGTGLLAERTHRHDGGPRGRLLRGH